VRLPQGKKSTVTVEQIGGALCVRKEYNDNGDPREKCLRETAFYTCYAGLPFLPKLLESRPPAHILIELLRGEPASTWHRDKAPEEIADLSRAHGRNIGGFLKHVPSDAVRKSARKVFPGGLTLKAVAARTLGLVADHLARDPAFDLPELHGSVDRAREVLNMHGFWGEEVLCKLDWNAGNTIVSDGKIAGYVDFEQSFFANRATFVGTVADHINVLSWPEVRAGIEEICGDLPAPEAQYAAACFSMCRKILGCCGHGRIGYFTPERLLRKFETLRALLARRE
jgi:hypothetical protein